MKVKMFVITTLSLIFGLGLISAQTEDIIVNNLYNNNTIVKVTPSNATFLLLPIEEQAPEAEVKVLVDGEIVRQMNVRLAQTMCNYYVPLKLKAWHGKDVVLNIQMKEGRVSMPDAVCWKLMKLSDTFDTSNTEQYRPVYHHTPLYGWMNDPNGMFYKDGTWHLYYQYNPYASVWGNMTWGHSTSKDLIHWKHHDEAILPDGWGTIFSGSAVVDKANTAGFGVGSIVAIYTSAGQTQQQSLAYSTDDGRSFTKYPSNPIILNDRECRDDNFFWDERHQQWALVMADALNHQDLFFSSPDLKHWTLTGVFGQGYGCQDGVWECPDLMELPIRGTTETKWVLLVNINPGGPAGGSATQYFIGDYDGKTFIPDDAKNVTRWLDYGKDHYATVSWSNTPPKRHTVIAWMSNWQYANAVPTMQYRSANTLPRDICLAKDDEGNIYVAVQPAEEIIDALTPSESGALTDACCVELSLKLNKKHPTVITLSNDIGEQVVMRYDISKRIFSMDRSNSGDVSFSNDFPTTTVAPTTGKSTQTLRLFIDCCSMEAFAGDGRFAMTNLVFPSQPYNKISVNGGKVNTCTVYNIKQ